MEQQQSNIRKTQVPRNVEFTNIMFMDKSRKTVDDDVRDPSPFSRSLLGVDLDLRSCRDHVVV